jgi:hypothetical protein
MKPDLIDSPERHDTRPSSLAGGAFSGARRMGGMRNLLQLLAAIPVFAVFFCVCLQIAITRRWVYLDSNGELPFGHRLAFIPIVFGLIALSGVTVGALFDALWPA